MTYNTNYGLGGNDIYKYNKINIDKCKLRNLPN